MLREAPGQVEKGWLRPPTQLRASGRPLKWRANSFNISFRFGAIQPDKLRSCNDLKRPMGNIARTTPTPIQLVYYGHIAQLSHPFRGRELLGPV